MFPSPQHSLEKSKKDFSMNYRERIEKLSLHVSRHPKDYQAVIARIKLISDQIDYERRQKQIERIKAVAKYRRKLNGEQAQQ